MYCKNCGSKLSDTSKFCSNCGTKVSPKAFNNTTITPTIEPPKKHKSPVLPIIICSAVAVICVISACLILLPLNKNKYPINGTDYTNKTQATTEQATSESTVSNYTEENHTAANHSTSNKDAVYTSITNPKLSAKPGTATVIINDKKYTVDDNRMNLDYAESITGVYLADIDDKYTIDIFLSGLHSQIAKGFKCSDFSSITSNITLYDFYDSTETDSWGSPDYSARSISTFSSFDKSYFKTTDMIVEEFDTSGITALYFNIVTEGATTGKVYDIEVLSVSDYSDAEIGTRPDVCISCAGSGSCFNCSGSGKIKYYNAVSKSMSSKNCTVCHGTGVCSTCGGTGLP